MKDRSGGQAGKLPWRNGHRYSKLLSQKKDEPIRLEEEGFIVMRVITYRTSIACFLLILLIGIVGLPDVLHLKDGTVIYGTVIETTEATVTIVTESGTRVYPMSSVDYIETTGQASIKQPIFVYEDNFNDPDSGWEVSECGWKGGGDPVCRRYTGGKYSIAIIRADWMGWSWAPITVDVPNFVVELEGRKVLGSYVGYGIIWGTGNDDFHCFYVADGSNASSYGLFWRNGDNGAGVPHGWQTTPGVRSGGRTNKLKLVFHSGQASLYVNEKLLDTKAVSSYEEVSIGVLVSSSFLDERGVKVHFDHIKVYELASE